LGARARRAVEIIMTPRIQNPYKSAPDGLKAMMALEASIAASGLEHSLMELVKMRASQINGCAFCLHMHATAARVHGETEMRLYMLNAWRESPLYSDRERAALAWTEALTRLADTGAPDADYELFKSAFNEKEQVNLTFLIGSINLWNRLQVGFRAVHPVEELRVAV
jgi:AhpD family alkylhydroperoxidase